MHKGALRSPPVGTPCPSARFAHVQILSQGDAARPREENFAFTVDVQTNQKPFYSGKKVQ